VLRARSIDGGVHVNVQIFRDLGSPVLFPDVALPGEQTLYVFNVEHGNELWATKLA
jgi:hypothetical protein